MEQRPGHPFVIEWHPFQLNPEMPVGGMDRRSYMESKFGGQQGAVKAYLPVQQHAEAAGLKIKFDKVARTPNTLDAHRLIHWAGLEGRQTAVVSAIMRAYWREGRDIGNAGVLADIAAAAGMDRAVTARLLASDADADDIRARDADARAKGVTAVPTFLIAQQYVVSGAQPPEVWGRVIEELVEKAKAAD